MATKGEGVTIREVVADVVVVVGSGLVSYGAWSVYEPIGFIVGGIMVIGLGIFVAK